MHIRYVEKAASDVLAFKKMFEHRTDVFISACTQLTEIGARQSEPPIDLLLIDVMNPNQISVENDVRTARQYTSAPIVFLAGEECGPACAQVLRSGAASVVTKQEMSAEMIYSLLENAKKGTLAAAENPAPADSPHIEPVPAFPGWGGAFDYLERGFDALTGASGFREDPEEFHPRELRRLLSFLRRIGERDLNASCECDAAQLLAQSREELIELAAPRRVPLLIDVAPSARFFVIGSKIDARLGLEALVLGLVSLCPPGNRLKIALASEEGDQTTLTAATDGRFAVDFGAFFAEEPSQLSPGSFGLAALRCGVALLGLRREQCDLSSRERGEIKLRL